MIRALAVVVLAACWSSSPPRSPPPRSPTSTVQPTSTAAAAPAANVDTGASDASAPMPTALKTRAHPFALYIARMHRALHPHWADGFLRSLGGRMSTDPINDPTLAVTLELSIDSSGGVQAITLVNASPSRDFNSAAFHAVQAAAPFPSTPASIRSQDGLVHLRWTLHRDNRECGTFGVEPIVR